MIRVSKTFLSHNVLMLSTLTIFRDMHIKKSKCKANSSIKPKGILPFFNKNLCSIDLGNLNDLLPYNRYSKILWPYSPLASVLKSLPEMKNKRRSQKRKKSLKRPKNGKGAV